MARTRTLHGKRVGWSVKLSQPMSDAADAMRGDALRAHWLESLIAAALEAGAGPAEATKRREMPPVRARTHTPGRTPPKRTSEVPVPGPVEAVRALAEASGVPLVPASQLARPARPPRCTHPGTRVIGGYCKECDRLVGPGGC